MSDGPLWTVTDFVAAAGGRLEGEAGGAITGLSIDSRTVAPGEAFFAIRGDRFDGHDFAGAALDRGAALAVVSQGRGPDRGARLLVPDDPLDALARVAAAARARSRAGIAAVTGSVGKTSSKEALRAALGAEGETHASTASFNNHWGVPLSLARLPSGARFAVFEIGMNHPGEITPLVRLVRPGVALVTTVAAAHLEAFSSVAEIAEAKAEIFLGLEPGGTAVIPSENEHAGLLRRRALEAGAGRIVGFGSGEGADARLVDWTPDEDGSRVRARIEGREVAYRLASPGRHMAMNSVAVLAVAAALGASLERAAQALSGWRPARGRGERHLLEVDGQTLTLIDESYNANPASMRAAIALLGDARPGPRGRRIAVLGDMLELGPTAPELHRALAGPLLEAGVDVVFAAGPLMGALWDALPPGARAHYATTSAELEAPLLDLVGPGDVVMIKGSLGSRMEPLVKALRARFAAASQPTERA